MNYKFNIRLKYSLFIILFTAVLLISMASFVFVNNRNLIIEDSKTELKSYSEIITSSIEKEIFDSVLELRLLNSRFYNDFTFLPQFVKRYIEKYTLVEIWDIEKQQKYMIKPSIIYGGELEIIIDTLSFEKLPEYFEHYQDHAIRDYDLRKGSRVLELTIWPSNGTPYYLNASISLDYLIDENVKLVSAYPSINTLFIDHAGIVVYSKNLQDINRKVSRIYPIDNSFPHENMLKNRCLFQSAKLQNLSFTLLVVKDLTNELKKNCEVIKSIALFVGIILIFILIIVGVIARRISDSLSNITNVAKKVSDGDFSGKIQFQRNDELGALIDTFNQMVDKLDFTFCELDSSNMQLQENIEELKRTKNELSQKEKLALIGETVSKISHEIQNKVGGISIWIQNLELYQNSDETVKLYTGEMKEALNSFLEMLNNFKMFYRRQELVLEKCLINDLIKHNLSYYENDLKSREIELVFECDDKDIELFIDPAKIDEVITNLLVNSLYYAPKQSVLKIITAKINDEFILKIINQGSSISEDSLGKLFQPFYSTKSGGSGLGLAISQNIIKAHKGEISIENLSDSGVCATIKLPGIIDENINS